MIETVRRLFRVATHTCSVYLSEKWSGAEVRITAISLVTDCTGVPAPPELLGKPVAVAACPQTPQTTASGATEVRRRIGVGRLWWRWGGPCPTTPPRDWTGTAGPRRGGDPPTGWGCPPGGVAHRVGLVGYLLDTMVTTMWNPRLRGAFLVARERGEDSGPRRVAAPGGGRTLDLIRRGTWGDAKCFRKISPFGVF